MLKGWRTLLFGLLLAGVVPALEYLMNVDWTQFVDPTWASVIVGVIMIALRVLTSTPILQSK